VNLRLGVWAFMAFYVIRIRNYWHRLVNSHVTKVNLSLEILAFKFRN